MKKFSTLLIIIGILVMLYPVVGGLYTQYKEDALITEWLQNSTIETVDLPSLVNPEAEFVQLQETFEEDNETQNAQFLVTQQESQPSSSPIAQPETQIEALPASEQPTPKPSLKPTPKPAVEQEVLGVIVIDKIKVKCPIVENVKKENLKAGIGHIPGTAALGQPGNSALAGHRSHTFGRFFNRLDELKEGDEILILTKEGEYRYIIYKKLVVKPDDISVLNGNKDQNIITLITCTPIYIATDRLIIHARLDSQTLTESIPAEPVESDPVVSNP